MKHTLKMIIALTVLSLPLSACGIKPSSVDAPQGEDKDLFPRTYPSKK